MMRLSDFLAPNTETFASRFRNRLSLTVVSLTAVAFWTFASAGPPVASASLSSHSRSLLAQEENGSPETDDGSDDDSSSTRRGGGTVTPVRPNYTTEGVIMIFLMAAALFPLCMSSHRGN